MRRNSVLVTTESERINPLHSNGSMHILDTVLYTFPEVLTRINFFYCPELLSLVIISSTANLKDRKLAFLN